MTNQGTKLLKLTATCLALLNVSMSTSAELQQPKASDRYPMLFHMVHNNPGEPRFDTRYANPDYIAGLGYCAQIPKIEMQCGLTYDRWQDNIVPLNSDERMWIDRKAASVRVQLKKAKDAGLQVYPFTDVLVLPKSIMDKYESEMRDETGRLSILKPRTEELIRAQIDELFWRYPDLDGLTIRFGETYLHDTPFHKGSSPVYTPEEHSKLLNIFREEICVKRNKKVFYRTWDSQRLHSRPELMLPATNGVEPHENLFIVIKHVNGDFLRNKPFNTTIGLGRHQQIVEISMNQAGIYGRNSHPYYLGKGVIDGWQDMDWSSRRGIRSLYDEQKVKGFWIWTWGDGWYGPYYDNEMWVNLNEYVIRTYIQNPTRSEASIFNEYAKEKMGLSEEDTAKLREMMLLSEIAVFYGQDTQLFEINVWSIRDQFLPAVDLTAAVKRGLQSAARREKRENIERWYKIEKWADEIEMPNAEDDEFLRVSSTYGRIKYEIIEQLWNIQLMFAELEVDKTPIDKRAAREAIDIYEAKWAEWVALKKAYPCCPTLYQDHVVDHIKGMPPFRENLEKLKTMIKY
ncbi:MAG: hypothetical protein SNH55_01725 [Rikenellaceae bacterium]